MLNRPNSKELVLFGLYLLQRGRVQLEKFALSGKMRGSSCLSRPLACWKQRNEKECQSITAFHTCSIPLCTLIATVIAFGNSAQLQLCQEARCTADYFKGKYPRQNFSLSFKQQSAEPLAIRLEPKFLMATIATGPLHNTYFHESYRSFRR